jgi:hypothetical protein
VIHEKGMQSDECQITHGPEQIKNQKSKYGTDALFPPTKATANSQQYFIALVMLEGILHKIFTPA